MKYGRGTCTIELENVSINVSESGRRRIVYFLIFLVCVCVCKTIVFFVCVWYIVWTHQKCSVALYSVKVI